MHRILTFVLTTSVVLLVAASPVAAAAAPPANDSFSAATQIAYLPFEDGFVDNTAATLDVGESGLECNPIESTVWYKIVPTSNYAIRVRVIPADNVDLFLGVYEGTSLASLQEMDCADATAAGNEEITVSLQSGHSYYVRVGGHPAAPTGQFTVKVRRVPPPANDNFGRAATVALGSISSASTIGATMQPNEAVLDSCTDVSKSVWYRFTPATTRRVIANSAGSDFDTVINVYTGNSLSSLALVACNDDRAQFELTSKVKLTIHAGTTYYFQIASYSDNHGGDLVFRLKKA